MRRAAIRCAKCCQVSTPRIPGHSLEQAVRPAVVLLVTWLGQVLDWCRLPNEGREGGRMRGAAWASRRESSLRTRFLEGRITSVVQSRVGRTGLTGR